jgi:flagellar assembly factor FliW
MKVLSEPPFSCIGGLPATNELTLPQGIMGFPKCPGAELLYSEEHLPFLWMRLHGPEALHFVVIELGNLIPGYEPEIFGEDAAQLDLRDPSDVLLLNIVTLRRLGTVDSTVNLIGPIIANRRTRIARQRVIANHSHYSAQHPLGEHIRASRAALAI